jgi:hypothetical protein
MHTIVRMQAGRKGRDMHFFQSYFKHHWKVWDTDW